MSMQQLTIVLHDDRPVNVRLADNLQAVKFAVQHRHNTAPDWFEIKTLDGQEIVAHSVWLAADSKGVLRIGYWLDPWPSEGEEPGYVPLDNIKKLLSRWQKIDVIQTQQEV